MPQIEELAGAAARAQAADGSLHFRGGRLYAGDTPFPATAPHLTAAVGALELGSARGIADGLALRRRHSDPLLHARLAPDAVAARVVFEMLEQYRVESLAELPGVRRNLRRRHRDWSGELEASGLTETATGALLHALALVCRARVTTDPVPPETANSIEAARFALAPVIGSDLARLRRLRGDQAAYADAALAIAAAVADLIALASQEAGSSEQTGRALAPFAIFADADTEAQPAAGSGRGRPANRSEASYRVFTRAYDRQLDAGDLVRPALLAELRERLDRRIADRRVNLPRLAARLREVLARPHRDGWDDGLEEGLIDGRRLAQLVASPTERRVFRAVRHAPVPTACVSILIDCSGSMRRHAETVAVLTDVLARALELAGATTELLGFTTAAWNGGRAARDWQRAGRPPHPGRLNEVRHLVLKPADVPWRTGRRGVAALLKEDLYREGVDGEAVAWACGRLGARPEETRLLLVVSDGSPMDSATRLTNGPHYLDRHLNEVVTREQGPIRILGLGVGLDLSPYYRRSQLLDLDAGAGNRMFDQVVALLADPRPG